MLSNLKTLIMIAMVFLMFSSAYAQLSNDDIDDEFYWDDPPTRNYFLLEPTKTFLKDSDREGPGLNLGLVFNSYSHSLSSRSLSEFYRRLRVSVGIWKTGKIKTPDNCVGLISFKVGNDIGITLDLSHLGIGLREISPYFGYQIGAGKVFRPTDGGEDFFDTFRIGLDFRFGRKFCLGTSYIYNSVLFGDYNHKQIAFSIGVSVKK